MVARESGGVDREARGLAGGYKTSLRRGGNVTSNHVPLALCPPAQRKTIKRCKRSWELSLGRSGTSCDVNPARQR